MNGRSSHEALANFAPEDEDGDVHSACTAVAALPDSFLDDLRRVQAEEPTTSRYKVLPEADLEGCEAPTLPPPANRPTSVRVRELNATIRAALVAAAAAPPIEVVAAPASRLPEEPVFEAPIVAAGSAPPSDLRRLFAPPPARQRRREERWRFAVGVAFVVTLLALAVAIVFAI